MAGRHRNAAQKAVERERYRKNSRPRLLACYRGLKEKPCADCGVQYPYYVMQFDHLDGHEKSYDLSDKGRSWSSISREAAKCEVVCANCHAERSFRRLSPPTQKASQERSRQPALPWDS